VSDDPHSDGNITEFSKADSTGRPDIAFTNICSADKLAELFPGEPLDPRLIALQYPMKIPPYYLSLVKAPGDPIWRQAVPDTAELAPTRFSRDPLGEKDQSPVPGLIHRYPDRAVFLVSDRCAMHCRHCMRRRQVGTQSLDHGEIHNGAIDYIKRHRRIREVILSGGDPFMLPDPVIAGLLEKLHAIAHVGLLRVHTRIPCTLPQRVTPRLAGILKRFHPLYVNIQFNHPAEITPASARACGLLADAGIPLGCQSVLLRGVNDDSETMLRLMHALLSIRVRPYYLHHPDPVAGTTHFRVPLRTGLKIMRALRGNTSGLCVPQYMLDIPGGGGKIPLLPQYIKEENENRLIVRNFEGKLYEYPLA
jgi:lysine 2,3-aminomutase